MSIAGKTMLLTAAFVLLSGAQSQSFAQEPLVTRTLSKAPKSNACSPLEVILVTRANKCELKKLSQLDKASKARSKSEEVTSNVLSYATEPTYYMQPVETPTPTQPPLPTAAPVSIVQSATSTVEPARDMVPADGPNVNSDVIFDLINAHRAAIGKPAFQKEGALCSLAQTRSVELHGELFGNAGYLHSGLYNRNLPYWITENAKWGSNEAGTVQWWLNSPVHRSAIEGDHVYSCGACQGSKCAQLFTSYSPKGGNLTKANSPIATHQ